MAIPDERLPYQRASTITTRSTSRHFNKKEPLVPPIILSDVLVPCFDSDPMVCDATMGPGKVAERQDHNHDLDDRRDK